MLIDNLAPIREPVAEKDQILQLLRGLGADYNSIIASLTVREVDVSIHSVHNILLTYEQRQCFQNLVAEGETISANISIYKDDTLTQENIMMVEVTITSTTRLILAIIKEGTYRWLWERS